MTFIAAGPCLTQEEQKEPTPTGPHPPPYGCFPFVCVLQCNLDLSVFRIYEIEIHHARESDAPHRCHTKMKDRSLTGSDGFLYPIFSHITYLCLHPVPPSLTTTIYDGRLLSLLDPILSSP